MISGLTIQDEKPNGKTYYEPVILTVKGTSQYNDNQISFQEIEGFWQLPDQFSGSNKPPEGTVAKFSLSTNPKRGPNARPGSMYMDIGGIYKADAAPIAPQQPTQQFASTDNYHPVSGFSVSEVIFPTPAGDYRVTPKDFHYVQGVEGSQQNARRVDAYMSLTWMLAAHGTNDPQVFSSQQLASMWEEWHEGYARLKRGEVPFVEDEPADEECPHTEWEEIIVPPYESLKEGDATKVCTNPNCLQKFDPYQPPQPTDQRGDPVADGYSEPEGVPGW